MRTDRHAAGSRRVRGPARAILLVAIATAVIALLAACNVTIGSVRITASGHSQTRTYDVTGFSALEVSHTFSVTVTRGDAYRVSVTVDDNLADEVVVQRDGVTLRLGLRNPVSLVGPVTLEAQVTMPDLSTVDASDASHVTLVGISTPGSLELTGSGASAFSGDAVAATLNIDLSGASRANLTGSADAATLRASGASRLSLADLSAKTATIDLSGASSGDVTVTGSIDRASISGASRLTYGGGGTLGNVTTSGVSSISSR